MADYPSDFHDTCSHCRTDNGGDPRRATKHPLCDREEHGGDANVLLCSDCLDRHHDHCGACERIQVEQEEEATERAAQLRTAYVNATEVKS